MKRKTPQNLFFLFLWCCLLRIFVCQTNFSLAIQYNVPVTIATNWTDCFLFGANEVGPSFYDILNLCPGPLAFGQISAINPYNYGVFFITFPSSSVALTINGTALQDGNTIFSTSTSFGIGNGTIDYNCSLASNSFLCWNIFYNSSLHYFSGGAFDIIDGYQTQPQINLVISSAPCWNQTAGTNCSSPGQGLCLPGTCGGGDNCENLVPVPVPVVSNISCQQLGTCDPYTGIYAINNKIEGSSCYAGDPCFPINSCLANGTCVITNFTNTCPLSNNPCLLPPVCSNSNGTAVCTYPFNDGATCQADPDYRCRQQDTCLSGTCVPGTPLINQFNTTTCITAYQCNATTGDIIALYATAGTPCNSSNLCLINATCDGAGNCLSNTTVPTPLATFCNGASCDPATGIVTYNSTNTGLDCSSMHPETQCLDWVCSMSECISFQPRQCPALTCQTATCDNSTGCMYAPLSNVSCGTASPCVGIGTCDNGTCVNNGPVDCSIYAPPKFNSSCGYFYCDLAQGCRLNATMEGQACVDPCVFQMNSVFNSNCVCSGMPIANPGCVSGAALLRSVFDFLV